MNTKIVGSGEKTTRLEKSRVSGILNEKGSEGAVFHEKLFLKKFTENSGPGQCTEDFGSNLRNQGHSQQQSHSEF